MAQKCGHPEERDRSHRSQHHEPREPRGIRGGQARGAAMLPRQIFVEIDGGCRPRRGRPGGLGRSTRRLRTMCAMRQASIRVHEVSKPSVCARIEVAIGVVLLRKRAECTLDRRQICVGRNSEDLVRQEHALVGQATLREVSTESSFHFCREGTHAVVRPPTSSRTIV